MKVFAVISILAHIGLVVGEAGYNYNRPYPVQNVASARPHPGVRGHAHQPIQQSQSNYQYTGYQQNSAQLQTANQGNSGYNSYAPPIGPQPSYASPPNTFHNVGQLTSSQFSGAAPNSQVQQGSFAASAPAPAPQETIIKKHIYVHVPPPEPEHVRSQAQIAASQPRKNYKIVFIKLPSYESQQAKVIQQALNRVEEKTLIYVLAKTPDESQAQISQAQAQRNKPEVYFIKYKAQTAPAAQPIPAPPLAQNSFSELNSGQVDSALAGQGSISLGNSIQSSLPSSHQSSAGSLSVGSGAGVSSSSSHSIPQPSPQYGPAHH